MLEDEHDAKKLTRFLQDQPHWHNIILLVSQVHIPLILLSSSAPTPRHLRSRHVLRCIGEALRDNTWTSLYTVYTI